MGNFFWFIIAIVIISTVVGAVAKLLNNMSEMNAARNRPRERPAPRAESGAVVRQGNSDMDRFLAEIDRLRKKNAAAPPPATGQAAPLAQVVQPAKQPDRSRARVIAELADLSRPDPGFGTPVPTSRSGSSDPIGSLPVATVVTPPAAPRDPTTRVTRIASRPRPVAKTPFARSLTGLLNSGQGMAMAIVLQEILGPPRCKKASSV